MGDFEEKLNAILSSPEAMAQVASLAQSLGQQSGEAPPQRPSAPESAPQAPPNPPASADGLSGLLGSLDPSMMQKLLPLLGELNSQHTSEREQLLYALRPFLKESRRDKIDKALQVARLIHLGKRFLGSLGE